jgi:hypothetical protein
VTSAPIPSSILIIASRFTASVLRRTKRRSICPAVFKDHLIRDRFWIFQAHTPFHSPYSGPNSFRAYTQAVVSRTLTLYTALRLLRFTVANFDEEGGRGLSDGLGVAAYNPGFNRDRGPVVVPGFRVHVDY